MDDRPTSRGIRVAGAFLFLSAVTVFARDAQPVPEIAIGQSKPVAAVTPDAIAQEKPSFFVHAELDRPSLEYYDGEQFTLKVRCEVDAYIYALFTQADQQSYVILPNSGSSSQKIPAKETVQIPAEKDTFRWTVSAPFGKERLKIIASTQRIESLEKPELRKQQATAISENELAKVIDEIKSRIPKQGWSEVSLELSTREGVNPKSPYFGKRYGVFFGVPEQRSNSLIDRFNKKFNTNYKAMAPNLGRVTLFDGLVTRRALDQSTGMEASQSLPDVEQELSMPATRENMKAMVTQWLHSVSKPQDTLIIFFSGHGAAFADSSSPGRQTTYLIPYDYIDAVTFLAMRQLDRAGELNEPEHKQFAQAEQWLRDKNLEMDFQLEGLEKLSGEQWKRFEQAENELLRQSCVTDDEFASWLQHLSGRRVIVILHACHSGGFAPDLTSTATQGAVTKGIFSPPSRAAAKRMPFRFLSPQLGRLKDIGLMKTALITAAKAEETALAPHFNSGDAATREPASILFTDVIDALKANPRFAGKFEGPQINIDEMGVFTYCLVNALLKSTQTLDVDAAGSRCAQEMQHYFGSDVFRSQVQRANVERQKRGEKPWIPEELSHQPVWFDHCQPKVLLKP